MAIRYIVAALYVHYYNMTLANKVGPCGDESTFLQLCGGSRCFP